MGAWVVWRLVSLGLFFAVGGKPIVGAARWDDGYYLTILRQGYAPFPGYGEYQQTNFFPLLPWATRAVQLVVRSEAVATNVVVSAASLATVLLLHTAARRWTTNPHAPRLAVGVLLLSPASIFLWLYYSEGLFLALSIAALLAADRDRHLTAGLLGAGVAATRTIGILITLPLLLAAWHHPDRRRRLCALVPFAGLAAVMAAQHLQAGDALAFRHTSTLWGRTTTLPWQTIIDRVHLTIVGGHFGVTFLADLGTVAACCALAWHARTSTIPRHVQLWGALMIATPLCSGLLFSWSRYMLAAWPAAIALGQLLTTRPRTTRALLTVAAVIVAAQRVDAWHRGFFVG